MTIVQFNALSDLLVLRARSCELRSCELREFPMPVHVSAAMSDYLDQSSQSFTGAE
jgi:hypothetical protein